MGNGWVATFTISFVPTANRVVFGLLDVAGSHEENQQIVSAARQTFQKLGSERFADEEINEADTMMEFCLELNLSIRRVCRRGSFLRCFSGLL